MRSRRACCHVAVLIQPLLLVVVVEAVGGYPWAGRRVEGLVAAQQEGEGTLPAVAQNVKVY